MASNPENVRLTVLMKLQEALDEEAILEEQMLALMHRFADRFTDRRVEINNLMVLHDHPLIDYGEHMDNQGKRIKLSVSETSKQSSCSRIGACSHVVLASVWESATRWPQTLRGKAFDETRAEEPDRRSCEVRPTLPPRKRDQEGKGKTFDSQRGEKKEKSTTPAEAPILMINQEEACTKNNISKSPTFKGREITFPPVTKGSNSSALIEEAIQLREGGITQDPLDGKPHIYTQDPLDGKPHISRSETLNFVIVRSIYPYNMLLGRTSMQKIGMTRADITGIPRNITVDGKPFNTKHKLNEYSNIKPIKQKRRNLGPDQSTAARKEVEDLTRAGILREAAHQTWVANPVMVKKSDEGWRMCVDFTDILEGRVPLGIPPKVIPGRLKRLPSDTNVRRRRRQDIILYRRRSLLLPKDALQFKKRRSNLNPKKCSFGVEEGPFLGHLITKQGIRANPLKVKAIADTEQPKMFKDIQSLNGKLAALSRFLSKGAENPLPFFKVFKSCTNKKTIQWTQEAAALQEMKKFIETLPMLTALIHGEVLMMYLTASTESISAALFARREEGQVPIYFVSRVLLGAKFNYPALEKLILAMVHAARRLRRYFQAHTITILTKSPIKQALTKPKKSGRVAKWAIELGEHDIVFRARGDNNKETPKDFIIEAPPEDNKKEVGRKMDTKLEETKPSCEWKLYTDGASSSDSSSAGLMLIDPEGKEYTYALRFNFKTTNNEAEYEALLAGLRITQEMEIVNLAIFVDSQLLVNQIKGIYAAKQPAIREYLQRTKETLRKFRSYTIKHIRRNQNKKDDALSKLASMTFKHLTIEVLFEVLARRIKAPQYKLIRGSKSFYTPWLRCITPPNTDDVIKEIHEGSCGFNMEPRSKVVRITKQGYYWLSMHRDVARIIQNYEKCKEQSAMKKRAEIKAIAAGNTWPFGVLHIINSKDDKYFKQGIFVDLCRGLKITQSFSLITEHIEIISRIEKQLTRSQQRWVDDLPQVLWIHKTLPRNNQEETPFSLTYGSEAIIPTFKSNVAKDDRGRTKEVTKRKESKEVASIEEPYYQNELRRHHIKMSNPSTYKVGDFVLLLQNNTENPQVWQGPHMIREVHEGELYKIIDASDHLLVQTAKRTNLRKFYM
ncbi:reverse transcriptase domain-containing protein [Tanacetum coccineum]